MIREMNPDIEAPSLCPAIRHAFGLIDLKIDRIPQSARGG
jgi:hypothetical protein